MIKTEIQYLDIISHPALYNMTPIKDHCSMITEQFLLSAQKPEHPIQINIFAPRPPRVMKNTIKESILSKHSTSSS